MHKAKVISEHEELVPAHVYIDDAEAAKILRHSFLTNRHLYDAFVASIESGLREAPAENGLHVVAKFIADRIIGEE